MGEAVSAFAMQEIQDRLESHSSFHSGIGEAFRDVFENVDESLRKRRDIDSMYSGTTAVVLLLRDDVLYAANCGDSRAVMGVKGEDGKIIARDLTVDQNPNSPEEQKRIEGMGGFVSPPPEPGLR